MNIKLVLNKESSKQLQDLLIEGLHSSAKDNQRDIFIIGLMVFLSKLNPIWTIQNTNKQKKNENKFIMLIVSLIYGEYRLLLQELTTIHEGDDEELEKEEKEEEKKEEEKNNQQHKNIQLLNKEQRILRILNLSFVCYEIFDIIFSLLIGEEEEDDLTSNNQTTNWQELSSTTLQLIQRVYFYFLFYSSTFFPFFLLI